jgi:hypothetical protein
MRLLEFYSIIEVITILVVLSGPADLTKYVKRVVVTLTHRAIH